MSFPTRGGAGEGDLVDVGLADERGARRAVAGHDRHHARGQLGLLEDLGQQQRGQGRGLGRLEHRGVAAGERRARASRPPSAAGSSRARSGPRRRAARPGGRPARRRACRPSRRSGRSGRPRAGCPRRATRAPACRRRSTRRPPARASAPGSAGRCGTGTCRARARTAPPSRAGRAAPTRPRAARRPGPAKAISATGCSVAGLSVGTRVPSTGSRKSPSMNSP